MIRCPACTELHQLQEFKSGACCLPCHRYLVRRNRLRTKPWMRRVTQPLKRASLTYIDLSRERFGT